MPRDGEHDSSTPESLGNALERPKTTPVFPRIWMCALQTTFKAEEVAFSWKPVIRVGIR